MERTEVNVTAKISLHDVLNALALLANVYPMERVAEYQIERIEGAARILRERMKDYEDAKDSKTAATAGTITPVTSNLTMPSGWSFSGLAPIAVETTVGYQWNSAPAVTVLDRRVGSPITRRTRSTAGSPSRRTGKGRRKDDVTYINLPYVNCKECYDEFGSYSCLRTSHPLPPVTERRVNAERRKVWDQRKCEHRRLTNNTGRRTTDKISFTTLPKIKERRELGVGTRRSMQDSSSKYLRRALNMYGRRATDNVPYSAYPVVNGVEPVKVKDAANQEKRVNASDRRKVNDWARLDRVKRISFFAAKGRRSTDSTPYRDLPVINIPPPMAEANQYRTKRRK